MDNVAQHKDAISEGKRQVNYVLPSELAQRIKVHAVNRRETISEFVERALTEYLAWFEGKDNG